MPTDDAAVPSQDQENLPTASDEQLRDLIYGLMSGEFAAGVNNKPATFPLTPFYDADRSVIVVTLPVAFSKKLPSSERIPASRSCFTTIRASTW